MEEGDTEYQCVCEDGPFSGEACAAECPGTYFSKDAVIICGGHGTCNDGVCTCNRGYYGEDCSSSCPGLSETPDGEVLECYGNGSCDKETLTCTCIADTFKSDTCNELRAVVTNHVGACTESSCNGKGTCQSGRCVCEDGYGGPECTPVCDYVKTCHDHGICNK